MNLILANLLETAIYSVAVLFVLVAFLIAALISTHTVGDKSKKEDKEES